MQIPYLNGQLLKPNEIYCHLQTRIPWWSDRPFRCIAITHHRCLGWFFTQCSIIFIRSYYQ